MSFFYFYYIVIGMFHLILYLCLSYISARASLHETAPRVMAVLRPLRVTISGLEAVLPVPALTVPDFPFDASRGSHTVTIEPTIFIDVSDFRLVDSEVCF